MSPPTGAYQTIDDPSALTSLKSDGQSGNSVQAAASLAGTAAMGAREAVAQLISAPMPDVNLYTEPLNPGAQLTLNDRVQLVLESCRPWSEFADMKAFNLPPASEAKLRVGHNVEVFFYNYLVVGFCILTMTAFVHPLRAILVALAILTAVMLYVIFPEDYHVSDTLSITQPLKHVIVGCVTFFTVFLGGVLSLLFFFVSLFTPIVLLHSLFREHSATIVTTI